MTETMIISLSSKKLVLSVELIAFRPSRHPQVHHMLRIVNIIVKHDLVELLLSLILSFSY